MVDVVELSTIYRDARGREFKLTVGVWFDMDMVGGRTTIECPGGQKFETSLAESAAISACTSQPADSPEARAARAYLLRSVQIRRRPP